MGMRVLPLFAVVYCSGVLMILAGAPQGPWTNGQTIWMNWGALALGGLFLASFAIESIRKVPENYRFSVVAILVMLAAAGWTYRSNITDTVMGIVVGMSMMQLRSGLDGSAAGSFLRLVKHSLATAAYARHLGDLTARA